MANGKMAARKKGPDFETGLGQLEEIVKALEGGQLNLDQALRTFEQGVAVARQCQQVLRDAEQRVQQVLQSADGELSTTPLVRPDEELPPE